MSDFILEEFSSVRTNQEEGRRSSQRCIYTENERLYYSVTSPDTLNKYLFVFKRKETTVKNSQESKGATDNNFLEKYIEVRGIPELKDEDCKIWMMRIATAFGVNLPYVYVVSSERINERDETTGSRPIVSKIPSVLTEELLQLSKHKILTLQDIGFNLGFTQPNVFLTVRPYISPLLQGHGQDFKIKRENQNYNHEYLVGCVPGPTNQRKTYLLLLGLFTPLFGPEKDKGNKSRDDNPTQSFMVSPRNRWDNLSLLEMGKSFACSIFQVGEAFDKSFTVDRW
ncbi:hypothetical protein CDAR_276231 [Caerostris darwini]|uniref:Site-specific DNA endonuclease n=1 Tax=Caerostris darwini TaxID=1538125 RepID=A0AAV4Q0G0_9ARAC|nr:hypothetical protein CDAR_276231 [Caerostris darwini]